MTDYQFFSYRPESMALVRQPFEVFAYPMGDVTVRDRTGAVDERGVQVLWVHGSAPDWSVVYDWTARTGDARRRVLVIPYLPSARGDKDTPSPARVNARLAAQSGITDIIVADPHSPVWLNEMSASNPAVRSWEVDLPKLLNETLAHHEYAGVIGPDAGSEARATGVADILGVPVYLATKNRDRGTGRLSGYQAPTKIADAPGRYLVVDDICDGGGTFSLLAQAFSGFDVTLDLWVTHGGFTKGVHNLLQDYRKVHTTDSLPSAAGAAREARRLNLHHKFRVHTLHYSVLAQLRSLTQEDTDHDY